MTSFKEKLLKVRDRILDIIFPKSIKCIFCDEELTSHAVNRTCEDCQRTLPFISRGCPKCGSILNDNNSGVCANCKANNFDFEQARSVFVYTDKVVSVIHRFKYSSQIYLADPLADYMSDVLATWDIEPDIITAVPLHKARERERGYNQSRLLGEHIAKKLKYPYMDLCTKIVDNPSQTTLDVASRKSNVVGAYKFIDSKRKVVKGKTILLIDDIYTTGSTVNEVTKVLKQAGADKVYVLTLAHGYGDIAR